MSNRIFIVIALVLCYIPTLWGQNDPENNEFAEILIDGKYTNGNIYVKNPSQNGIFCVKNVMVNGTDYPFTAQSNAFEISLREFQPNDFVFIQIYHTKESKPLIINSEILVKESEFSFPSFIYSKKKKLLEWKIDELENTCHYDLEQLLYGKWIAIKDLGKPSEMIANTYLPTLLSGMNFFRIKQTDLDNNALTSPLVKVKSPNLKVMLLSDKVKDFIEFTAVTHYELFDENGFFLKRGTAQKVNVSDLKKGTYWINFDGKETMVNKK
ncbi:MAG: hypothetical protein PHQ33_03870 [Bacteroidales bacterium]|jgi:hypothetical protein|nr:hypothetical protein [Bacteroidales bacterium]MDD4395007.1 hypothetical protein [Bacteroidales bacterium]